MEPWSILSSIGSNHSLEINSSFKALPYVSNVQTEPVVVKIDKLDLVLEENPVLIAQSPTASGKSNSYGFADKVRYLCYLVNIPKCSIFFLKLVVVLTVKELQPGKLLLLHPLAFFMHKPYYGS
ncbi:hypothetical protein YC2023_067112 [Brassica napus]